MFHYHYKMLEILQSRFFKLKKKKISITWYWTYKPADCNDKEAPTAKALGLIWKLGLKQWGDRAFTVADHKLWNSLALHIRTSPTLDTEVKQFCIQPFKPICNLISLDFMLLCMCLFSAVVFINIIAAVLFSSSALPSLLNLSMNKSTRLDHSYDRSYCPLKFETPQRLPHHYLFFLTLSVCW